MQLNGVENDSFIEPEAQEENCFVNGHVREWRRKYSCDNFNPSIVSLKIAYTIILPLIVTLLQRSFEKLVWKYVGFL